MTHKGIVLGVGAPNRTRDGSKTMCAIVLTEDLGFIRVYPIPAEQKFEVWSNVVVAIERTATDNRPESYKLKYFEVHDRIEDRNQKRDILEGCVLKSGTDDPIEYCNSRRTSIALVKIPPNTDRKRVV